VKNDSISIACAFPNEPRPTARTIRPRNAAIVAGRGAGKLD
jgi:hypothetical protein